MTEYDQNKLEKKTKKEREIFISRQAFQNNLLA